LARADKLRKSGSVVAVAPAAPEAWCFSLIATRGSVRIEKIARIREQIRQGTYHIGAAEVAKAILWSKEIV
jgi:anti-sigma28 factor (negative regulator of flagellin synthesis)